MPTGQDGRWRPGTREDQRREAAAADAAAADAAGLGFMGWLSAVVAALNWVTVLLGLARGREWRADGLLLYVAIATGWTLIAGVHWWGHLRRRSAQRRSMDGAAEGGRSAPAA